MIIKYEWSDMPVQVLDSNQWGNDEPHYHTEYQDVEYEYSRYVSIADLVEYFDLPNSSDDFRKGLRHAIVSLSLEIEEYGLEELLEDNENFVDFMKEKYEEEARKEYERNHE